MFSRNVAQILFHGKCLYFFVLLLFQCDEYQRGLIAGTLCYDMCIEQTFSLSGCVNDENGVSVSSFIPDQAYAIYCKFNSCKIIDNQMKNCAIFLIFAHITVITQVFGQTGLGKQCRPSLIRVFTVCYSICIFWWHFSAVRRICSNFRVITAIFWVFENLGLLRYVDYR